MSRRRELFQGAATFLRKGIYFIALIEAYDTHFLSGLQVDCLP
jgi:hypothetical protein